MNEHHSPPCETEAKKPLSPLVERLDPSIGELSTVVGAMMTELLRRTLRGSVSQIDEELQVQVTQKVDATVAQRLPAIEQAAAEVADKAAREAATEVTFEGIRSLEQRAQESERGIVARIETTARAAEEQTAITARSLSGKIEQAEKKAEQALSTKIEQVEKKAEQALSTKIEQVEKKAEQALAGKSQELVTSIEHVITSKGQELASNIEAAERRAHEAAQAEIARHVEDLMQRSKKTVSGMKDRLQTLDTTAATLTKGFQELDQERRKIEENFRTELTQLRLRNDALAARVVELEKPRGLRGLWAKLSGGKKGSDHSPEAGP